MGISAILDFLHHNGVKLLFSCHNRAPYFATEERSMFRAALLALLIALPSAAFATFDATSVIQMYDATRPECRQAESLGGTELTKDQSEAACERLEKIGAELKNNGYCFDQSEQEWAVCKP
jgi:hypothetical protein